ncbi:MAG TPA: TetR/AcrR family transcriptional regulator [Actinophytocola sp.]|uniref:TetR/AcrR family transcriptional regulator n=1 Tax=Actinophytocola sp. TaxID=1872138 RepID=UPI002DDD03C1|nr:TetR/AcrR family transcriptional regulator [Actinophytocola sp.]HEV2778876.1 TetR/AcrR family transcriptional regulator [Actinophytocola sp.]
MAYHHGDLRRVVLDTAQRVIAESGPAALNLRDLARRAGVSHAAPAYHFGDKAGLLTAIAVEGYELLADALAEAPGDLRELGVRYVRFALDHPAHFEIMFRPDLYHRDAAEVIAARDRAGRRLRAAVRTARPGKPDLARLAAWSLAHGFTMLWRTGNLGDADPAELFRAVAGQTFTT